ncbi:hypothetical protein PRZ48_009256 [Zasmidium cellare]|uniref:Uncharacterized protein n=1 Tax=Zasmidium cellare TaxID=395010 RepID=A0ABR0EBV8_ZASCE|nr:hypothetical protein PRZ48_009256 [Zasmidium cellare]
MSPSFSPCKIHDAAVAGISSRVRQFHEFGSPFRIYHGTTNSTRKSSRRHDNVVDISRLNLVLSIGKKTAIVEPNVPMDKLVEETLKRGLIPPVVMEFPADLRTHLWGGGCRLDYMDGILFARDHGVVCLGKLVDAVPERTEVKTFSKPWDDWFYINAENMLADASLQTWTEYIPIQDYLFRYERGAFWISKYTYRYFAVPLNRFTRWLLDTYTHTRVMYNALHHSGLSYKYIIQDVAIPYKNTSEFVSYLDINFRNYPLWLCPLRMQGKSPSSGYGLLAEAPTQRVDEKLEIDRPDMMLNFGVWGPGPSKLDDFVAWNKAFESELRNLGGQKWLYAHTYYTEDDFWSTYGNRRQYDDLRAKYHASSLPSIYDKVRMREESQTGGWWMWLYVMFWSIWPLAGLYGWVLCVLSEEYLLPRKGLGLPWVPRRKQNRLRPVACCNAEEQK